MAMESYTRSHIHQEEPWPWLGGVITARRDQHLILDRWRNTVKACELQSHLQSLNGGWMDPEKTVDTFKSSEPDAEVQGIAVAWMSYT